MIKIDVRDPHLLLLLPFLQISIRHLVTGGNHCSSATLSHLPLAPHPARREQPRGRQRPRPRWPRQAQLAPATLTAATCSAPNGSQQSATSCALSSSVDRGWRLDERRCPQRSCVCLHSGSRGVLFRPEDPSKVELMMCCVGWGPSGRVAALLLPPLLHSRALGPRCFLSGCWKSTSAAVMDQVNRELCAVDSSALWDQQRGSNHPTASFLSISAFSTSHTLCCSLGHLQKELNVT